MNCPNCKTELKEGQKETDFYIFCPVCKYTIEGSKDKIYSLFKKINDSGDTSWVTSPDRSGGQFTKEEIERSRNTW